VWWGEGKRQAKDAGGRPIKRKRTISGANDRRDYLRRCLSDAKLTPFCIFAKTLIKLNSPMARVITYIDGFNLYFGMKNQFQNKYLWLDVEALSNSLIGSNQVLAVTKYFTSRVTNQPDKEKRQRTYLEALQTATSCQFYYGRYQPNVTNCKTCGSVWPSPKEKMTDVNIATQMLMDAYTNAFDTAILVSGDTDLIPPILAIKQHFSEKMIGVAFPPSRHSIALQNVVDFSFIIGRKKLRDSQLPSPITKPGGFQLVRPSSWI